MLCESHRGLPEANNSKAHMTCSVTDDIIRINIPAIIAKLVHVHIDSGSSVAVSIGAGAREQDVPVVVCNDGRVVHSEPWQW